MSADAMATERAAVLRERAAYLKGAASQAICSHKGPDCEMCRLAAAAEYPLPKVTRPRVVVDPVDPRAQWKVFPSLAGVGGELGVAHPDIGEGDGDFYAPTLELSVPTTARVKMWANLLANPTEDIEVGT